VCDDRTVAEPSAPVAGLFPGMDAVEVQVPEAPPTTKDLDDEDEEEEEELATILDPMPRSRAQRAAAPSDVADDTSDATDPPTIVPTLVRPRSSSHVAVSEEAGPRASVRPHPALRPLPPPPVEPEQESRPLPPRPAPPSERSLPMSERIALGHVQGDLLEEDVLEPTTLSRDATTASGAEPPTLPRGKSSSLHRVAFPAPQFSPPRQPQPFVVPASPTTARMLDETRVGVIRKPAHLVQSSPPSVPFVNLQAASSSIAPVAMSTALGLGSRADRTASVREQKRPATTLAMVAYAIVGLLATSVVGIVAFVPGVRGASSSEKGLVAATPPPPDPPSSVIVAPPAHVPPASLDLRPPIEPDMTYVTFPASAEGDRVYVDGQVLETGAAPAKIKCGPHTIKIGSAGKPRSVNLPCGDELALTD